MKQWIPAIVSAYGLLIWLGGMVDFAWTQSYWILFLGSLAGSVLVVSGFTLVGNSPTGYWGALTTSFLLSVCFAYRTYYTQHLMPLGVFAVLSILMVILLLTLNFLNKK